MKTTLLTVMIFVCSVAWGGTTAWSSTITDPPSLQKFPRRITSSADPIFGGLIGRSERELIAIKGEPAEKSGQAWVYRRRLGPGAHSFRYSLVVKFARGKVVEVEERRDPVGCILIPPPRK